MKEVAAPARRARLLEPVFLVSAICFAGYFIISRVVLDLFPFSTYSMYSSTSGANKGNVVRGCHLLARGPDGIPCDVTEFRSWECPPWEDEARKSVNDSSCPLYYNVEDPIREYINRNRRPDSERLVAWVEGARPDDKGAVKVDLVRRVWAFVDGNAPITTDHLIVSCRAVPR